MQKITARGVAGALLLGAALCALPALAQSGTTPHGPILVPDSTIEHPRDIGRRAHTNHLINVARKPGGATEPTGETPSSIRSVYELSSNVTAGGSNVIVIVDAFDYPTAEDDLAVFSEKFGLPACTKDNGCFTQVYASGTKPRTNCGWAQEAALDIEWAHAMAPNARIVLVEADSNSFDDLFDAVDVASELAADPVGEVSMSWGGSEFWYESDYDSLFTTDGVVYFAASGDRGGANIYPSVSPNVVSAGGTRINRDADGTFTSETGWSGSGGGPSRYEPRPEFQDVVSDIVGDHRGAPDFSFDSDPASGVSVYDSTPCQGLSGWLVFGGTSVASPALAGIVNSAGHFLDSSATELSTIYGNLGDSDSFRDITSGRAGRFRCATGWDFVTGVGSDQGLDGK
jgi:kumamolisin